MLTGDAEAKVERELLAAGVDLSADVLKMGHHGSNTSSTLDFVQAVSPDIAIYQAGEGNPDGHPHEEAIASVLEADATVYWTDLHGTVVISSDGHTYSAQLEREAPPVDLAMFDIEPTAIAAVEPSCIDINTSSAQELTELGAVSGDHGTPRRAALCQHRRADQSKGHRPGQAGRHSRAAGCLRHAIVPRRYHTGRAYRFATLSLRSLDRTSTCRRHRYPGQVGRVPRFAPWAPVHPSSCLVGKGAATSCR